MGGSLLVVITEFCPHKFFKLGVNGWVEKIGVFHQQSGNTIHLFPVFALNQIGGNAGSPPEDKERQHNHCSEKRYENTLNHRLFSLGERIRSKGDHEIFRDFQYMNVLYTIIFLKKLKRTFVAAISATHC